jgi:hypothetical protein
LFSKQNRKVVGRVGSKGALFKTGILADENRYHEVFRNRYVRVLLPVTRREHGCEEPVQELEMALQFVREPKQWCCCCCCCCCSWSGSLEVGVIAKMAQRGLKVSGAGRLLRAGSL